MLYGPDGGEAEILKLALRELVARGWLELDGKLLSPGPERPDVAVSRPLEGMLETFDSALATSPGEEDPDGVSVGEVAIEACSRYGSHAGYVEEEVLPSLEDRGLYELEEYRRLGIFPASRWVPTTNGEAARAELESRKALAEEKFGEWVEGDPARARSFLALAGPSVLLMGEIHPEIQRLGKLGKGGTGGYPGPGPAVPGFGAGDDATLDPGPLDSSPGALEGLFDAFPSIDAGIDRWGGSGGLFGGDFGAGGFGGGDGGGGGAGGGGGGGGV